MLQVDSPEHGEWHLPPSSWAIPLITYYVTVSAVVVALAMASH
jgi:hypothetical protein